MSCSQQKLGASGASSRGISFLPGPEVSWPSGLLGRSSFPGPQQRFHSSGSTVSSNQSVLREINPEYPLEGLMLKLKLQYFGHLTQRVKSLEKTLILGKTECKRRRGRQRMRWLDSITDSMDMEFEQTPENSEGQGSLACCSPWDCRVRHNFATEQQQHRKIYL